MIDREQTERKLRQKLDEIVMVNQQALQEIAEKEDSREEMARIIKNQEYENEKLKRIIGNKDEEFDIERRRFTQKWDRKVEE